MKHILWIFALILMMQSCAWAQIKLQWDPPSGYTPSGYNVYRNGTGVGFTPANKLNAAPVAVTTYTDATCTTPGTSCFYSVTALNGTTESTLSNVVKTDIPAAPQPPPPPTNLSALCTAPNAVTLNWVAATGAESYYIEYGDNSGSIYFKIEKIIGTTHSITVVPDTTYWWLMYSYAVNLPLGGPSNGAFTYGPDFKCTSINPPVNLRIVINAPKDGSTIRFNRSVTIRADALNGVRSELYVDDSLLRSFNSGRFSYSWTPRTFRGKTVELKAKTYSTLGPMPVSESAPVHVTIR